MAQGGQLSPGTVVGDDYQVIARIGVGGMGEVYRVMQLSTGKERALKVPLQEAVRDDLGLRRFKEEAKAVASIASDHITEVIGAGTDPKIGLPWIAMVLLHGQSLEDRIGSGWTPSDADIRALLDQLFDVMTKAHAAGIVHRDLKPENIFIEETMRRDVWFTVKVLDFGLAKVLPQGEKAGKLSQPIGSPLCISPEQLGGGSGITAATDVWALGLLVFYLITGKYYWLADPKDINLLVPEILSIQHPAASKRAQEKGSARPLPNGFDDWFGRCVHHDAEKRWKDAGAAWESLARLLEADAKESLSATAPQGTQVVTVPPSPPSGLTQPWNATLRMPALVSRLRWPSGGLRKLAVGALGVSLAAAAGVAMWPERVEPVVGVQLPPPGERQLSLPVGDN